MNAVTQLSIFRRYNKIKQNNFCQPVEYDLIKHELNSIDKLINLGENELTWKSESMRKIICYVSVIAIDFSIEFFFVCP